MQSRHILYILGLKANLGTTTTSVQLLLQSTATLPTEATAPTPVVTMVECDMNLESSLELQPRELPWP